MRSCRKSVSCKAKKLKIGRKDVKSYLSCLGNVEKRLNRCWYKLNYHIRHNAGFKVIKNDRKEMLFLLGECNFLMNDLYRNKRKFL